MSLLCWNCRGLRNPQTVQSLGDLIQAQDLAVVFVVKTWLVEARLKVFLKNLNFGNMHVVSKINQGGGLVLLWRVDVQLRVVPLLLIMWILLLMRVGIILGGSRDFTVLLKLLTVIFLGTFFVA